MRTHPLRSPDNESGSAEPPPAAQTVLSGKRDKPEVVEAPSEEPTPEPAKPSAPSAEPKPVKPRARWTLLHPELNEGA